MKKQLTAWLLALVMLFSLVGCGADAPVQDDSSLPQQEQQDAQNAPSEDADTLSDDDASAPQIDEDGTYTTKDDVALYIHTYGHLPNNFIDTLGADSRGAKRIVFSNDGLIYYTEDHYETFELLYGEE